MISGVFFLGWFLGILSTILGTLGVDFIKKRVDKKEFKKGIFAELQEIRLRLAATVYLLTPNYGLYNRDFLTWIYHIFAEDTLGIVESKTVKAIEEILKFNDKQIDAFGKQKSYRDQNTWESLRSYNMPFLDANISRLSLFDMEFQRYVIQIRGRLGVLNEETSNARFYFEKTFDSTLSEQNHKIIKNNLDKSYESIMKLSELLAKHITYILQNF